MSFLEETVYHVFLAGLRDRDLQERCISGAILKTIKDIPSLVEFCSAEDSGRMPISGTVGGVQSKYKKQQRTHQSTNAPNKQIKCGHCGGPSHSPDNSPSSREKSCKAFNATCHKCGKKNHLAPCCKSKALVESLEEQATPTTDQPSNNEIQFAFYGTEFKTHTPYNSAPQL